MKAKTQKEKVLDYLKNGYELDQNSALIYCGVHNLADVIMKLRKKGHNISCVKNTSNTVSPLARYKLVKED